MSSPFVKFCFVGSIGFLIDVIALYLFLKFHDGLIFCRLLSFTCAVVTTWHLNSEYTFARTPKKNNEKRFSTFKHFGRYLTAMGLGAGVNFGTYLITITLLPLDFIGPAIGVFFGSIFGLFFNYNASNLWVWKSNKF
ncbi:MAG: GtrA family protein [Paracoccaceae bacterium]